MECAASFSRQVRIGPSGFEGFDLVACQAVGEAQGVDRRVVALFLTYWEQGVLAAYDKQRDVENS